MAVVNGWLEPEPSLRANEAIRAYFAPALESRRAEPRDDLLSTLVHEEVDGHRLTEAELDAFILLLFSAGSDTTYHSASNLFFALLTHPDQLDAVRRDRSLVPKAVEEALRWETGGPQFNLRRAVNDVNLGEITIPAGADVVTMFGSELRDESLYDHAHRFDLFRSETQRSTFGTGPHTCLGNHLARMELRTALTTVLDRLDDLRLDPDEPPPAIIGTIWRGPERLPVLFRRRDG